MIDLHQGVLEEFAERALHGLGTRQIDFAGFRVWREELPEEYRSRLKLWRDSNLQHAREYRRCWAARNRDRVRAYKKAYSQKPGVKSKLLAATRRCKAKRKAHGL